MKEVTPAGMKCCTTDMCPAIFEVTPADMKCAVMASCPAIFDSGDVYAIIGKIIPAIALGLSDRVGPGEGLFLVPKALIDGIQK